MNHLRWQLMCVLFLTVFSPKIWAGEIIVSDFCRTFSPEEIPVGDFTDSRLPMEEMRITQKYNNSKQEGWCQAGGLQPSADSSACQGQKIYYGHAGLDLHPQGDSAGENDIFAIQDGLVIASHKSGDFSGWGESIILATRTNHYSQEVLTFHFHHLYADPSTNLTTRLYNACSTVGAGDKLAKEGGTPYWPTHLHLAVKRWANAEELQAAIQNTPWIIYGQGYVYGQTSLLQRFLDPEGLLYEQYSEFSTDRTAFTTWQWAEQYALETRSRGWYFGQFDGSFGVDQLVTRREAARLVKIAGQVATIAMGSANYFYDVPPTDPDFPYINTLSQYPSSLPVINPVNSCTTYGHNFCPDRDVTRAEAIKMVVATFFSTEFLEMYDNWLWQESPLLASNLLAYFRDVSPYTWYAPYVYMAWKKGLLAGIDNKFHPNDTVRRGELAKWLVLSHQLTQSSGTTFCQTINCEGGYYCEEKSHSCQPIPSCVPQEEEPCPLGGGYVSSGTPSTADAGTSLPDTGNDSGLSEPLCHQGSSELAICPDGLTATYRTCLVGGYWTDWNPPCWDEPASDAGSAIDSGNNTGADATIDSGYTYDSGGTGGSGGSGETNTGGSGGTSSNTGGSGGTTSACTVTYTAVPTGASCHENTQASGSPTLCLELQPLSGPTTSWRLCKKNSVFQNAFTYRLLDQNHLSQDFGGSYTQAGGVACTAWRTADFSYLNQNGSINGAGLTVEVHSPTGCTDQACTYYSGITTVYRQCE